VWIANFVSNVHCAILQFCCHQDLTAIRCAQPDFEIGQLHPIAKSVQKQNLLGQDKKNAKSYHSIYHSTICSCATAWSIIQGITQLLKVADKKETMAKMNNMKQRESLRVYFFLSRRSNNRRHATKRLQSLSKFRESRNLLLLNTTSVSDCLRLPQLNIITQIRKSCMS
jgi:hypothetical protein